MFEFERQEEKAEELFHPCSSCFDKPCLSTCPVEAFTPGGYDYVLCKSHIALKPDDKCFNGGCLARHACPVGKTFTYEADHQAFHMKAFV